MCLHWPYSQQSRTWEKKVGSEVGGEQEQTGTHYNALEPRRADQSAEWSLQTSKPNDKTGNFCHRTNGHLSQELKDANKVIL